MKACDTCFYRRTDRHHTPCKECCDTAKRGHGSYSHWVPVDVFKNVDDKSTGVKYDSGKPQWSLLPFKALTEVVEVLTYGAKKYAPDNWKKVPDARRRYIDAGFRHFTAYASGETHDPETGKHHLAHAICCLLYLIAFDLGEHNDKSNSDV